MSLEAEQEVEVAREGGREEIGKMSWRIRPMRQEDVDQCLVIWSKVELTEARHTVSSALAVDPEGFYVAELEGTGEIIGMCAGTMTRLDTAFMGFYAVEPRYQRLGIGRELWATTLGRLDASTNVGLYGVPAMSEKYKKSGFTIEDSTRMLIYESQSGCPPQLGALKDIEELLGCRLVVVDGSSLTELNLLFKKLVDYDHSVQKFSRERLLAQGLIGPDVPLTLAVVKDHSSTKLCTHPACDQHYVSQVYAGERKSSCCAKPSQESIFEDEALSTSIKSSLSLSTTNLGDLSTQPSSTSKMVSPVDIPSIVSSTTLHSPHDNHLTDHHPHHQQSPSNPSDGFEVLGYGTIRLDNNSGGMIGPIYADSSDICEVLLRNLMDRFELQAGKIFSVMALSSNKQACKILTKVGLREIDQCSRMFTKFVPAASFSKIYYVHSPNFTLF